MSRPESAAAVTQLDLLRKRIAAISEENDLLLSQLNRLIDEPRLALLGNGSDAGDVDASDPGMLQLLQRLWAEHQPREWQVDMRHGLCGANWHGPEADGRWAGPEPRSLIRLPSLAAGDHEFCLEVVDAMTPELLSGTRVQFEGAPLPVDLQHGGDYPAFMRFRVSLDQALPDGADIELLFPFVVSPRERGVPDDRILAIRVREVRVTRL
jgi:hypothetical protein